MEPKKCNVCISYSLDGVRHDFRYTTKARTLDELKQSFLKRFGNIYQEASNKAIKEYDLVKRYTQGAETVAEWVESINNNTKWELIIEVHQHNFRHIMKYS